MGSLSPGSSETQANGGRPPSTSRQAAKSVVFPQPGGAVTTVTRALAPSCRRRTRVPRPTSSRRTAGAWSFVASRGGASARADSRRGSGAVSRADTAEPTLSRARRAGPGPRASAARRVLEDPAEVAEADGAVDALGHFRRLEARRLAAPCGGVVNEQRGDGRPEAAPARGLEGPDVVDPAVAVEVEREAGGHRLPIEAGEQKVEVAWVDVLEQAARQAEVFELAQIV